jgi:hypothetical protein
VQTAISNRSRPSLRSAFSGPWRRPHRPHIKLPKRPDTYVTEAESWEDLRIEIRKDILELQAQGYDPKIIEDDDAPALPAPKRCNGSNGHG